MTQTSPSSEPAAADACEVLVIGGGPGGSTAAALLAAQGRRVVLLEKAHHPRFHIGESLLPANVALFERLGVREQVEAIGMPKWGVEFVSPKHAHRSFVEFGHAWDKGMPMAWQVRRSELDALLFSHAAARGAQALQGCQVRKVDFDAEGATVHAVHDDGAMRRWRARFVVDASGRDTLLAQQFSDKRKNARHNSAAIFGHFTGAQRLQGAKVEGNISIFWFAHGWFWFIPLADGTTSVGATCWPHYLKSRSKPLRDFFLDTIALAPPLAARLKHAQLVDDKVHATGNYSYSASRATGERWLMLGDAFTFIDPVFSSGVYLAMANAFAAVDVVTAALDRPPAAAAARRRYERHIRRGPRTFSWFIYRMTNPTMRDLFMRPSNVLRSKEAVLSVLAGDVYGGSPIGPSLGFFKLVYGIGALARWRSSWAAWQARRRNIRDVGALAGENVLGRTP
jgi:flavin-dependent dehydrogenase